MWAKIFTIKRTKDLNDFSLCAFNLFDTQVSKSELNYWNKWTFPRHYNLLRCTCMCIVLTHWKYAEILEKSALLMICCDMSTKSSDNVHLIKIVPNQLKHLYGTTNTQKYKITSMKKIILGGHPVALVGQAKDFHQHHIWYFPLPCTGEKISLNAAPIPCNDQLWCPHM